MLKDLKPSTRQRFLAMDLDFPAAERELAIIREESGADHLMAHALVSLAYRIRTLGDRGLAEVPSTRFLMVTALLAGNGVPIREACIWMVQADEPHQHADDPLGLQRPTDRDQETSAEEFGNGW